MDAAETTQRHRIASGLLGLCVPIESLHQDPANLRAHSERSLKAVTASLARFGQQKPIVFDERMVVVAGNGTLECARRLGWTHIAAVRSDLAGIERVGYAIADNRTAELSAWDQDALRSTLQAMDADTIADAGFDDKELAEFMGAGQASLAQDEPPEPVACAVARIGDLWTLGAHRLLCGDSTQTEDVTRLMDGSRARLFATDPPYLVGYDGTNHPQSFTGGANKDWSDSYGTTWDDADENSQLYDGFLGAAVAHALQDDTAWYCWHASKRQAMLEAAWNKHGAFVHCQIIWAKNRPVLTRTWYMWQHEPCLMGWKKGCKPDKAPEATPTATVWEIDTIPNGEERPDHPTPKPIEVFAIPMRQHTRPGDVCYEPFSGSGTQIVAAEQLGRRCFSIEISPVYVDVAVRRWQKLTGQAARLDGDGRTWAEIAADRGLSLDTEGRPCPARPNARANGQAARSSRKPASAKTTPKKSGKSRKPGPGEQPKARRTRAGTGLDGASSGG